MGSQQEFDLPSVVGGNRAEEGFAAGGETEPT
jgi:hypothetical protein